MTPGIIQRVKVLTALRQYNKLNIMNKGFTADVLSIMFMELVCSET